MLSNHEVEKLIASVLHERLEKNGFLKSDVQFDYDFDGEKIIRVTAHVEKRVTSADELFNSADEIQKRLLQSDDERFVYLKQDYPGAEDGAEAIWFGAH